MGFRSGALSPRSCSPWASLSSFGSVFIEQRRSLCSHWMSEDFFYMSKGWDEASQKQNVLWNKIGCLVCNSAFKALCLHGSEESTVIPVFVPLLLPTSECDSCRVHHWVSVIAKALNWKVVVLLILELFSSWDTARSPWGFGRLD